MSRYTGIRWAKTGVGFTGRQMRMRIDVKDSEDGNKDVRIGDMRVGVSAGR